MNRQDNKVMITDDYGMFSFMVGNREIDNSHINRLIKSFKIKPENTPIYVNEHGEILDGQHSFKVRKILKLPILYIVIEGGTLETIHRLNTNRKGWTFDDHARSWTKRADPILDYQMYLDFKKRYKFSHEVITFLLTGSSRKMKDEFVGGQFKVTQLDEAIATARKIEGIKGYYPNNNSNRSFAKGLVKLFGIKEFNYRLFLTKLGYKSLLGKKLEAHNVDEYLTAFVKIYNTNTPTNKKLPLFL